MAHQHHQYRANRAAMEHDTRARQVHGSGGSEQPQGRDSFREWEAQGLQADWHRGGPQQALSPQDVDMWQHGGEDPRRSRPQYDASYHEFYGDPGYGPPDRDDYARSGRPVRYQDVYQDREWPRDHTFYEGRGPADRSPYARGNGEYGAGELGHRGRGPKDHVRSDDRIHEDVCDRLYDEGQVDASDIEVSVKDQEVTLSGTVDSRRTKRRAEDCADHVSGVTHVQNNLRFSKTTQDEEAG
jgi:hypothetical protein